MTRTSGDAHDVSGDVCHGFDYDLEVWVETYIILNLGHPPRMGPHCCNARIFAGQDIRDVRRDGAKWA